MNPGARIKQLRLSKGMTLEELGDRVGVGKSTVRKWETGAIANMRRDKIANLAEALDTTVSDIMGIEEKHAMSSISFDSFSSTERQLISAWRQAAEKDRRIVAATLEEYGFRYQEDGINAG